MHYHAGAWERLTVFFYSAKLCAFFALSALLKQRSCGVSQVKNQTSQNQWNYSIQTQLLQISINRTAIQSLHFSMIFYLEN